LNTEVNSKIAPVERFGISTPARSRGSNRNSRLQKKVQIDQEADPALRLADYINAISTGALSSGEIGVLSSDAAQATVDTISNLFLAGVQNASSSIGTIHGILNKTTPMQADSLVLGENPVGTASDNLIVQARRVSISSKASAAIISLDSTGIVLNGSVNRNVAATFDVSASDANVRSVTSSVAVFKQDPHEFAGEKDAGIASAVTSLELQSDGEPGTKFPGPAPDGRFSCPLITTIGAGPPVYSHGNGKTPIWRLIVFKKTLNPSGARSHHPRILLHMIGKPQLGPVSAKNNQPPGACFCMAWPWWDWRCFLQLFPQFNPSCELRLFGGGGELQIANAKERTGKKVGQ
jgi:hypothetical protein